jgi:hypothetical protein
MPSATPSAKGSALVTGGAGGIGTFLDVSRGFE